MRIAALLLLLFSACRAEAAPRVLLFSEVRGFEHDAIPTALDRLTALAEGEHIQVIRTSESNGLFEPSVLATFDAVVFVMTTGDALTDAEVTALSDYVRNGGAVMAIHSAADTEHESPAFLDLIGAEFRTHPAIQRATIRVEDLSHPSTASLSRQWARVDEWYDFVTNPRGRVHVLMRLDERSYSGGSMGDDHPIAWCQEIGRGRTWYTGLGHTRESYDEPLFIAQLRGALRWSAGLEAGDCRSRNAIGSGARLTTITPTETTSRVSTAIDEIASPEVLEYRWSGTLMPRFGERYTFRLSGSGRAEVGLNGRVVLLREGSEEVEREVALEAGKVVHLSVKWTPQPGERLRLTWRSSSQIEETIGAPQLDLPRPRLTLR